MFRNYFLKYQEIIFQILINKEHKEYLREACRASQKFVQTLKINKKVRNYDKVERFTLKGSR